MMATMTMIVRVETTNRTVPLHRGNIARGRLLNVRSEERGTDRQRGPLDTEGRVAEAIIKSVNDRLRSQSAFAQNRL
jgi:hypothetical protein